MPLRPPPASTAHVDPETVSCWFRRHARDLPWRRPGARSGYAALVSELMAQQTQIARVAESFQEFMRRFPTPAALARAGEQEVLTAWRGLGYYRRALHLHAAARVVMERFDGQVPADPEALRTLPGVGPYTAGAVASIAFGRRAPIVDGNVARVLLRVAGRHGALDEPATARWLWSEAGRLVQDARDPATFNEGLMELGAVLCTPRSPRCDDCPLRGACAARRGDLVEEIPRPRDAALRRTVHHHAVVVRRRGRLLVEQRPARGLWARMWQVPTVEADRPLDAATLRPMVYVPLASLEPRGAFVHATTHRLVQVHVFSARARAGDGADGGSGRWIEEDGLDDLPMSSAALRAIRVGSAPA